MAGSEVSKEVSEMVAIEEKCGLDMSSYQDLPKPDCNGANHHHQANDLDNSYVFVTGADGLPDVAVGDKDVVVGGSAAPPEPKDTQNEKLGAVDEAAQHLRVNGNVEQSNGEAYHESSHEDGEGVHVTVADSVVVHTSKIESLPEAAIKQVKDSDGSIEGLAEPDSVADSQEVHIGYSGSAAEADVEQVEDSNGKTESMPEAEVKKAVDQSEEIEGVAVGEQDNFDGVTIGESSPCPVEAENQESQVRPLGLVAEIDENRESNTILLNINSSNSASDGEDQSNTSITEALEARDVVVDVDEHELQSVGMEAKDEAKSIGEVAASDGEDQSSTSVTEALEAQDVVLDVDEHGLQSVGVEAKDEAKSIGEAAEAAEHEVSTSTSLSLDSESLPTNNMDKTNEEEANTETDLCSNILENQQGDTGASSIAQDMVGEIDESKPVVSSIDSHVKTTCDLVLEEKNGDSSVFEVENGAQYPEESQEQFVMSSTDSQGQTTHDSVLEEKSEDSSVSVVENGAQYPEESQEQLVVSSMDSHVLTTCGLVLEETNKNSYVSEIDNCQYHEQPVVSSTDSQVQTTCDLILEDTNEDSSVSEIENGAHYHVESQEQPVVSSTDSHVQTTCDLVLEETNEDSSVLEVENGAQYPEESQVQPVVSSTDSHVLSTSHLVLEENNQDSFVSEVENGSQYHEEYQEQPVVSETTSHVLTTCDLVLEGKNKDSTISEVENGAQYPVESEEQRDGSEASHDTPPSKTMSEASDQSQSYPAPNAHALRSETEVSDVEEIGSVSSPPAVGPESQIIEEVVPGHDIAIRCTPNEASSASDCALDMVVPEKAVDFEGEVSSGNSKVGDSSPKTLDVKLEIDGSVIISGEQTDDVSVTCRTEISDSFNANSEGMANIELEVEGVEDVGNQLDNAEENSKENLFVLEVENIENSQNEETSVSSAGVSTTMNTTEDKSIKAKTKPFNFLIRTPRFDDENLRDQIRLAKLQVDEKTKLRDAIQLQIQEIRQANSQNHGIDYEYAKSEGRSARKSVRSKRMEIDSLQSVINKAKNALSIEDIDSQIHNMEHMIQHETLPLKEEKQFIREIKQLKQLREQLSSNMGSQDEIKQALEQRPEVEERIKILRKELDLLKNKALKAEAIAAGAGKKYDDEIRKVKELQAQFRAADDVRQTAYAQWQNLRKELANKNKYFFKYKDDAAVASNYAFSRDTEALYCLCTNQVGSFIELWNMNPEFRRDYIKFNARSNIRRFGTLDCRSLGPNEVPLAIPSYADGRGNKMASVPAEVDLAPQTPSVELKQKAPGENLISDSKSLKKVTEPKGQKVANGPAITVQVNGLDTRTGSDLTDEVYEEPIKSRDEIESMRKAEEMRRQEAEVKLKEQRRLEALEKANEARERKKRQTEKLQQRAELKTQKEAEQREKEREKRLRKKERKKAGVTDANDTNNSCETAPSSESAVDIDVKDMPPAAAKKAQKPWLAPKQSKTKSIPPPLRNRNKKKLQQWMWVGITSLIILVLFWLGNIGVFSNVALKRRAPVY